MLTIAQLWGLRTQTFAISHRNRLSLVPFPLCVCACVCFCSPSQLFLIYCVFKDLSKYHMCVVCVPGCGMASNLPGNSRTIGPATCPINGCTFAAEFSIVLQHIRRSHSPLDVPSNFVVSNGLSQCPTCKNYFKKIQFHVARCSKPRNASALEAEGLNVVSGTVPSEGAPSQSQYTLRGSNRMAHCRLQPVRR